MSALVLGALYLVWQITRLTLLSVMILFEPFMRIGLCCFAWAGILSCVVFETSPFADQFPFWGMITLSIACAVTLVLYYQLMGLLAR